MGVARDNIEAALIATGPAEKIAPQVGVLYSFNNLHRNENDNPFHIKYY